MSTLSAREIAEYAYQAGFRGERLTQAVAVALAESNGVTNAKGDTTLVDGKWGPSIGLWQIRSLRPSQQDEYPEEYPLREQKANLDPLTNAKHAFAISDRGTDWSKWSTYGGTRYHEVMDRARAAAQHVSNHPPTNQNPSGGDQERGGRPQRGATRPGRIVLDLAELSGLEKFFAHAADRVRHTRVALGRIGDEVTTASSALPEPALAALIRDSFAYLSSPATLQKAEARLDWHARYAARVRRLAERADGRDDKWTRGDAFRFLNVSLGDGKIDHAERAVLEGLMLGQIVRNRRGLGSHLDRSGGGHQAAPTRPQAVNLGGLRNARVPDSRLASVGDGERMLKPVAKQFLRMKAAARAAGIDLHVNDGYRDYAEQAHLYELYQSGRGNLAAPPGQSNHGLGISVDINIPDQRTYQWLVKHADEYGFVNDVPSENWHWTYKPRG